MEKSHIKKAFLFIKRVFRILFSFEFFEESTTLVLKFLGLFAVFTAILAVQEPDIKIYESGQLSILNMDTFFNHLREGGMQTDNIEKTFYDTLNDGKSFNHLMWIPNANRSISELCGRDDAGKKESHRKQSEFLESLKDPKTYETNFQKNRERLAETMSGFGEKSKNEKSSILLNEECATENIHNLIMLFLFKYGVSPPSPFNLEASNVSITGITVNKEQVYKIIKSFNLQTRVALFEEIAKEQNVLTVLKVKNDGKLEARDTRIRFNFILNTVRAVEGITRSSSKPSWEIAKQPILVEGGTIIENPPYNADISYKIIPCGESKWIYVMTKGQDLLPETYFLEPPPYVSRISPSITLWGSLTILIISLFRTIWIRLKKNSRESIGTNHR